MHAFIIHIHEKGVSSVSAGDKLEYVVATLDQRACMHITVLAHRFHNTNSLPITTVKALIPHRTLLTVLAWY